MRKLSLFLLALVAFLLFPAAAGAGTLQVGLGRPYAKPCAAILAAAPGDTIEIDSTGNYDGDVCRWTTNNLTIRGVGTGRAKIDAKGMSSQGKAIWVIAGDNTTVENIEFTGATVPDQNGAGIRQEGANLTVRNCYFHHNEDGILAGDSPASTILVEFSEFAFNGFGDGQSHNIYVNHVGKFIFRYNYSHHSIIGHLVKTRAAENHILYNRLSDEATGTGSYELDLPNGGKAYVIGNLIEQGPQTDNNTILTYLLEGPHPSNPSTELFIVNNTFVNDLDNPNSTFILIAGATQTPVVIKNNIFVGVGTLTTQAGAVLAGNFRGDPLFVDGTNYDYHLRAGSPAVNAGIDPGTGAGVSLVPVFQYVHPACAEGRVTVGQIDAGGYELGGGTGVAPPLAPSRCSSASAAPAVSFSASSLTFGNQAVNTSSAAQGVTLTNAGNAPLTISAISTSGDFAQTNTCGSTLAAGASCNISVTFRPSTLGNRTGALTITDNAAGSPHSVALSGTGATFSLWASPPLATVNAGQSASYTLSVTPAAGFTQAVSLGCSGAPSAATCSIAPSSLTPDGSSASTATITVTTTARSLGSRGPWLFPPNRVLWAALLIALIVLFSRPVGARRRVALCFSAALLVLLLANGCANTGPRPSPPASGGTPTGTSTLTITGTSGSVSMSTTVVLQVN